MATGLRCYVLGCVARAWTIGDPSDDPELVARGLTPIVADRSSAMRSVRHARFGLVTSCEGHDPARHDVAHDLVVAPGAPTAGRQPGALVPVHPAPEPLAPVGSAVARDIMTAWRAAGSPVGLTDARDTDRAPVDIPF